jgi:hypothetical protein
VDGECRPSELLGLAFGSIALDETHVYANRVGHVVKVAKQGGEVSELAGNACRNNNCSTLPVGIAVDDSQVYYGAPNNGLHQVPVDGGVSSELAPGLLVCFVQAVDGFVYWADLAGGLSRIVPETGVVEPLMIDGRTCWYDVSAAGDAVYWTDEEDAIRRAALPSGEESTLASAGDEPWSAAQVAYHDGEVYSCINDQLVAIGVDSGTTRVVAEDVTPCKTPLRIDGGFVHWGRGNAVMRAPTSGGEPEELLRCDREVNDLALDADSVFVSEFGIHAMPR